MFNLSRDVLNFHALRALLLQCPLVKRSVNILVDHNTTDKNLEEDIFDDLCPGKAPTYSRIPEFFQHRKNEKKAVLIKKSKDVVIVCKNPKLNHFRNQKYDSRKPLLLASNGWHHSKSKGDYFSIKVCDHENYIENLFWEDGKTDFNSFQLDDSLVDALKNYGFTRPTKIQAKSIPLLLSGKNSLITAETGCGKTLAYLIPVINQILNWLKYLPTAEREFNQPLSLVLAPSRDLAEQIASVAAKLSYVLPFRSNLLIGGRMKKKMLNPDFKQIDLQVSTPGALTKLVTTGLYDLSEVKHVILDEGDTLLDESFTPTLIRLLRKIKIRYGPQAHQSLPRDSQLTIVSATMPRHIYETLDTIVEKNSLSEISTGRTHQILPHVQQTFYRLGSTQKAEKIIQIVKESLKNNESVIVFSNKTATCDWLSLMLNENGIRTVQLNSLMPEMIRRDKFKEFQEGGAKVLSCTDIASRGLDTINVRHIINYDFPKFMADYIHRSGRTGRVGSHAKCQISNFISTAADVKLVQKIETAVRMMNELPNVNGNIRKIIQDRYEKFENV